MSSMAGFTPLLEDDENVVVDSSGDERERVTSAQEEEERSTSKAPASQIDCSLYAYIPRRKTRSCAVPDTQKSKETVTLDDLLRSSLLHPGEKLEFNGLGDRIESGVLLKDGWIEYGLDKLPDLDSWILKILKVFRVHRKKIGADSWEVVSVKGHPISHYREEFLSKTAQKKVSRPKRRAPSPTQQSVSSAGSLYDPGQAHSNAYSHSIASDSVDDSEESPAPAKSKPRRPAVVTSSRKKAKKSHSASEEAAATDLARKATPRVVQKPTKLVDNENEDEDVDIDDDPQVLVLPHKKRKLPFETSPSIKHTPAKSDPESEKKRRPRSTSDRSGKKLSTPIREQNFKLDSDSLTNDELDVVKDSVGSQIRKPESRSSSANNVGVAGGPPSFQLEANDVEQPQDTNERPVRIRLNFDELPPAASDENCGGEGPVTDESFAFDVRRSNSGNSKVTTPEEVAKARTTTSTTASSQHDDPKGDQGYQGVGAPSQSANPDTANNNMSLAESSLAGMAMRLDEHEQALASPAMANEKPKFEQNSSDQTTASIQETELKPPNNPEPTQHVILGTGLKSRMLQTLQTLVETLGGKLVHQFVSGVTHVVTIADPDKCTPRTMKYSSAVLSGAWILSFDWVLESMKNNAWADEAPFEIQGDTHVKGSPLKARKSLRSPQAKRLFSGLSFYFLDEFPSPAPSKEDLNSLVTVGSGQVLDALPSIPQNVKEFLDQSQYVYVICDPANMTMEHAAQIHSKTGQHPVSFTWILDSISHYELQSVAKYRVAPLSNGEVLETQQSLEF